MRPSPSVLIVDRSEENREVLAVALARRGIRTFAAARAVRGAEIAHSLQPDLIVLDLESSLASPEAIRCQFADATGNQETPMVLLGTVRRVSESLPGEIVAKPYHYGPLIRKIEEILGMADHQAAKVA